MLFFSRPRFALLCREIQQDVELRKDAGVIGMRREDFRWERDALIALQMCTEHVLTLFFEMTYPFIYLPSWLLVNVWHVMPNVSPSNQRICIWWGISFSCSILKMHWGMLTRNVLQSGVVCNEQRRRRGIRSSKKRGRRSMHLLLAGNQSPRSSIISLLSGGGLPLLDGDKWEVEL